MRYKFDVDVLHICGVAAALLAGCASADDEPYRFVFDIVFAVVAYAVVAVVAFEAVAAILKRRDVPYGLSFFILVLASIVTRLVTDALRVRCDDSVLNMIDLSFAFGIFCIQIAIAFKYVVACLGDRRDPSLGHYLALVAIGIGPRVSVALSLDDCDKYIDFGFAGAGLAVAASALLTVTVCKGAVFLARWWYHKA